MIYILLALISIGVGVAEISSSGSSEKDFIDRSEIPEVPETAQQWITHINADDAYEYLTQNNKAQAGDGVTIGISDTGIQLDHPDIAPNALASGHHAPSVGSMDHGTHVAGIAAGAKNGSGIFGVAYKAKILSINIIDSGSVASGDDGSGIIHAFNNGAKVVNMSWLVTDGGGSPIYADTGSATYNTQKTNFNASLTSTTTNDIFLSAATGNDANVNNVGIMAAFAEDAAMGGNMIAVAAVDFNNNIASFSNHCKQVKNKCMVAPGVAIYSSIPTNSYENKQGTSMAAPHVAGAAAVLRAAWPSLTAAQTVQILLNSATDLGNPGVDDVYGHGLLNLLAAVQADGAVLSASLSVNSSGYNPQSSSITVNPIFGNAFANNVSPIIQNAVFFDNYGRDYKADLDQKILTTKNPGLNLDELLFNNFNTTSLPINFGENYSNNIQLRLSTQNIEASDQENYKFNKFGIKNLTYDKSKDNSYALDNSNIMLSYSKKLSNDLTLGFSSNDFYDESHKNNIIDDFGFSASMNPYNQISLVNFSQDDSESMNKKQFFISQNLSKELKTSFSFSKNYQNDNLSSFSNLQNKSINSNIDYELNDRLKFGFGYGSLEEYKGRFLGSKSDGAFSNSGSSKTDYFKIDTTRKLSDNLHLVATYSEGSTDMSGNEIGIFRKFSDIKSRGFSVALLRNNIFGGKIGIIYNEPLSVYQGSVDIDIPVSRNIEDDGVNRLQNQNVSLKADGQERNLEVVYKISPKSQKGEIDVRFLMQEEPNNIKYSKNQYSGLIRYNLDF